MSILVLHSPRRGAFPYRKWLNSAEDLVLICDKSYPGESGDFQKVLHLQDYFDDDQFFKAVAELQLEFNFRAIFSSAECDVIRAAQAREIHDIEGQEFQDAMAFRDKFVMKSLVSARGIAAPHFAKVHQPSNISHFSSHHGWPVVVKPLSGSGSYGVRVIEDEGHLNAILPELDWNDLMVESYVTGPVYHVDGFVFKGRLEFCSVSRYINTCLTFQESITGSVTLKQDDPLFVSLQSLVSDVLDALPRLEATPFHAEFFIPPGGKPVFCEIACRTGGALVAETILNASGVNLDQLAFHAQMVDAKSDRQITPMGGDVHGFVLLPPRSGKLISLPAEEGTDNVAIRYRYKTGDTIPHALKSADWMACVLGHGATTEETERLLRHTADKLGSSIHISQ